MIAGRPTNLWLGLTTAISGAISATLIVAFHFDPTAVGVVAGVWQGVLGAGILLIAAQPPAITAGGTVTGPLQPGDTVKVVTPAGEPNRIATVH